jgi:hypothetical protein
MRRTIALVAALLASLAGLAPVGATSSHDVINFFPRTGRYVAYENAEFADLQLQRCCHGLTDASVDVTTSAADAAAGEDYTETRKTVRFVEPIQDNDTLIPVLDDSIEEPVERFDAHLENPTGGSSFGFPNEASVFIVDNDGAPRIGFILGDDHVFENRIALDVIIVRSGDPSVPVSASWTTVDGTAVAGADYEAASGTLDFAASQRRKTITVNAIDDDLSEGDEMFSLTLSSPVGATLTDPSTFTIRIADDETPGSDSEPPVTAFHQPLHDRTYKARDLTDILVFADDADSGIKDVHIALRKKLKSGDCAWYRQGSRSFKRGPCGDKTWIRLPGEQTVVYSLRDQLQPSTRGEPVSYYTAWSRGIDQLGNIETEFVHNRNFSRFEIEP